MKEKIKLKIKKIFMSFSLATFGFSIIGVLILLIFIWLFAEERKGEFITTQICKILKQFK